MGNTANKMDSTAPSLRGSQSVSYKR
jgi:hypothetical protein